MQNKNQKTLDPAIESALNTFIEVSHDKGLMLTEIYALIKNTWHEKYDDIDKSITTLSEVEKSFLKNVESFLTHYESYLPKKDILVRGKTYKDTKRITSSKELIIIICLITFRMLEEDTHKITNIDLMNKIKSYYLTLYPKTKWASIVSPIEKQFEVIKSLVTTLKINDDILKKGIEFGTRATISAKLVMAISEVYHEE